jgi:hypothetical protein
MFNQKFLKMNISKKIICLVLLMVAQMISSSVLYSQSEEMDWVYENKDVLMFGSEEVDNDTIRALFYALRNLERNTPDQPGIIFSSKNGKFHFGVGGYVKAVASYDFEGVVNSPDFVISKIPVGDEEKDNQKLRMDASTSNLSFKAILDTERLGIVEGYFSANFRGSSLTFQLQDAYVRFLGILAGYAPSTMEDLESTPVTIDYQGPNAETFTRNTQIRYTADFNEHLQMAVALEMPHFDPSYSQTTAACNQRVPDVPLYFQYSWKSGSHIRLTGLFRDLRYLDVTKNEYKDKLGWGIQLSGSSHFFSNKLTLYYQTVLGQGVSEYIQDLSGLSIDMIPSKDVQNNLKRVPCYGWYFGVQYNFLPNLFSSVLYSQVEVDPSNNEIVYDQMYKRGQYLVANLFWDIIPTVRVGVEYLHGRLTHQSGADGHANRVQAQVQYNF